ncbi:MAG TPA: hypothetical protein VNG93_07915 [Candidatus Dormibacteraeota bacterium]|nr:hypothetical protein [Candidatus Dormibacteraeota bacterium]
MTRLLRFWWVGLVALAVLAGVGIAFGPHGLLAGASLGASPEPCSPAPCAAPHGFEVDVVGVKVAGGVVEVQVGFKNHTPEGFGAGNYRPTLPSDFQLQTAAGGRVRPSFGGGCTDWGEIHVVRGSTAGPLNLCFRAGTAAGAQLIWAPDLGILFSEVAVPLS